MGTIFKFYGISWPGSIQHHSGCEADDLITVPPFPCRNVRPLTNVIVGASLSFIARIIDHYLCEVSELEGYLLINIFVNKAARISWQTVVLKSLANDVGTSFV